MARTFRKPPPPHVVIVGGGLAGMSAAAGLVGHDLRITLFEGRPRLGGRASSFPDPVTGRFIDNCQHISMGCCTNLADFCRRVGIRELFRPSPTLRFLGPDGSISTIRAVRWLPAPLHLAGSLLGARYLSWRDRLRVAYGVAMLAMRRDERPGESLADWLARHGQNVRTMSLYWNTSLASALNESLDAIEVAAARKVFVDGLLRNRGSYVMEVPSVPLGEMYDVRAGSWLEGHGVDVRLRTGVDRVDLDHEGALRGVTTRDGEEVAADFVVVAVPHLRAAEILGPSIVARMPELGRLKQLGISPITGVYLQFDRRVCPYEHVATVGRLIQWVFRHPCSDGLGGGEALQVVISASRDLEGWDRTRLLEMVRSELAEIWPAVREARLERSWVVTEHAATFSVRPGYEALRPPQRTPVDGLFLAGDWTRTGWPSTMEGAVRSGYLAAEGVLEDLGRSRRLVRPDLPWSPLSRWLFAREPEQAQTR